MNLQWIYNEFPMDLQWVPSAIPMEWQWFKRSLSCIGLLELCRWFMDKHRVEEEFWGGQPADQHQTNDSQQPTNSVEDQTQQNVATNQ